MKNKFLEVRDLCRRLDSIEDILRLPDMKGSPQEEEYLAAQENITKQLLFLIKEEDNT